MICVQYDGEMVASNKVVVHFLVIAVSIGVLVMGDRQEHRTERRERSIAGQYPQSEIEAELAAELQWLREKTTQVPYAYRIDVVCIRVRTVCSSSTAKRLGRSGRNLARELVLTRDCFRQVKIRSRSERRKRESGGGERDRSGANV